MTILSSDYLRIIFGSWSNRLYIGGSNSRDFPLTSLTQNFMAGAVFGEVGL